MQCSVHNQKCLHGMYLRHLFLIDENKNLKLIDAPVSGGVKRASEGTLTVCNFISSYFVCAVLSISY